MFCSQFSFLYWKYKIRPKIFCILLTYLYLCVWNWLLPFPDILVKTKHWLLLWSSRKSLGNFLSEYTTAPIMVGFICGKHIGEPLVKYVESMFMPDIGCEHSYIWRWFRHFLGLPRKTLRIVHTLLLCLFVSSLMIVGCRI